MWWYYNDIIFPQIPTTNTPELAHDTGSFVSSMSDLCSAALIVVLYVIAWYIGPRYNGTYSITIEVSFVIRVYSIWYYKAKGIPAGSSTNFRFRHARTVEYEWKHLMPCQNARSFIADDHISHIRIKFPKLSTTCTWYKHYVEDLTTISFFKMTPHRGRLRSRWLFTHACVDA